MFQSMPLCVQPTGSTNAETLHSGIWAPTIARNASTQTLAQICVVTASQETWSSLPAETSLQSVSNARWSLHLVSSSLSAQHRVRGSDKKKPASTSTSATICIKTSFTIVQGCSTSSTNNDGESFEQRKKSVSKVSAQCACTVSDDNLFPTTSELKGGLVKTKIYKWSQCTCSRCQCTCSRQ